MGGATVPNATLCTYTWVCSSFQNVHPTDAGYVAIAAAFASALHVAPIATASSATRRVSKMVGRVGGTHEAILSGPAHRDIYTFTVENSGPVNVGNCPDTAFIDDTMSLYDSSRTALVTPTVKF